MFTNVNVCFQVRTVMVYVLENLYVLSRENTWFVERLRQVPFITTRGSGLRCPWDLYDPEAPALLDLLYGQDVFPAGQYASPAYLVLLRQLALRTEDDLTASDIYTCALSIEEQFTQLNRQTADQQKNGSDQVSPKERVTEKQKKCVAELVQKNIPDEQKGDQPDIVSGVAEDDERDSDEKGGDVLGRLVKKSEAVVRYLDRHPHRLEQLMQERSLRERLCTVSWVASLQDRLPMYPDTLPWHRGPLFAQPRDLASLEWFPMIGSVVPLCKEPSGPEVARAFGWDATPRVETVVAQLAEVMTILSNKVRTNNTRKTVPKGQI